jgi:tetratricopeptide (TPR) repeat protein
VSGRRISRAALAAIFAAAACGPAQEPSEGRSGSEKTVDEPEPEPVREEKQDPGVRDDGSIVFAVEFFEGSLAQALEQAEQKDKLVLVDVGAYWCPPCHELDEKTFIDPGVAEFLAAGFVSLHVDAEKGEGPELVERYAIQAYPTLLVLESSGVEKGRVVDFVDPKAFVERIGTIAAGGNVLASLQQEVESAPDDLEKKYRLANAYALAAKRDLAEPLFSEVLAGDPNDELGLASKVLSDRAMFFLAKLDDDHEGAIAAFRQLQKTYPESPAALRAHRQIGRNLKDLGRDDEAVAELEAMIQKKPDDVDLKASYGWFSFREKCRPEKGLVAVRVGIEQKPDSAELRYLEAELLHLLAKDGEALIAIRKASELEPASAYYRRQVRRFEELTGGG